MTLREAEHIRYGPNQHIILATIAQEITEFQAQVGMGFYTHNSVRQDGGNKHTSTFTKTSSQHQNKNTTNRIEG